MSQTRGFWMLSILFTNILGCVPPSQASALIDLSFINFCVANQDTRHPICISECPAAWAVKYDGNQKSSENSPLGMVIKHCKWWDQLPSSTGEFAGFLIAICPVVLSVGGHVRMQNPTACCESLGWVSFPGNSLVEKKRYHRQNKWWCL